jgi:predicted nucleic acid-binding protein
MAGIVFDTNIWIGYKPTKLPNNLVMSAVVLHELVAGAADRSVLKALEASKRQYEKENKLLVPSGEDWFPRRQDSKFVSPQLEGTVTR